MSSGSFGGEETKLTDRETDNEEIKPIEKNEASEENDQNEEANQNEQPDQHEEAEGAEIPSTMSTSEFTLLENTNKEIFVDETPAADDQDVPRRQSDSEHALEEPNINTTEEESPAEDHKIPSRKSDSGRELEEPNTETENQNQLRKSRTSKTVDAAVDSEPPEQLPEVESDLYEVKPKKDVEANDEFDLLDYESEQSEASKAEDTEAASHVDFKSYRKSVRISNIIAPPFQVSELKFTLSSEEDLVLAEEYTEFTEEEKEKLAAKKRKSSVKFDRNMYYQMHEIFKQKYQEEKMKNNCLQAKLAHHYMRRNMLHVLREQTLRVSEIQSKYEKDLDALEQLMEKSEREKSMTANEVYHTINKRDVMLAEIQDMWAKLLRDEVEYGKSLTFEKTGKTNMDKIVERFVKRQKNQMALTIQLRLDYIKLRNRMAETLQELEDLDHLGPGYRIMDFVQLKIDNRDLHDKLEEKDGELVGIRKSCQNTMQILAHIREKIHVLDLDIQKIIDDLDTIRTDYEEILDSIQVTSVDCNECSLGVTQQYTVQLCPRQPTSPISLSKSCQTRTGYFNINQRRRRSQARLQLLYLRKERDGFRESTKKLKTEHSLLVNRKALRDMEAAVIECTELDEKIAFEKSEYEIKSNQLAVLQKRLDQALARKAMEDKKEAGEMWVSSSSTLFAPFKGDFMNETGQ